MQVKITVLFKYWHLKRKQSIKNTCFIKKQTSKIAWHIDPAMLKSYTHPLATNIKPQSPLTIGEKVWRTPDFPSVWIPQWGGAPHPTLSLPPPPFCPLDFTWVKNLYYTEGLIFMGLSVPVSFSLIYFLSQNS